MKVKDLGTIFIRVSNLDEALPFYSEVLGLQLRDVEQWDDGRGANYKFPNQSTLLTLIEVGESLEPSKQPNFNLVCSNILEAYEELKSKGIIVGSLNQWSSDWNDHFDFDIFDPDGNSINLIEWTPRKS
ncbi:VOC family protein [Paenibacillus sp. D2_2]|uniref:VOC family protein n=1 Tax=Paenibacillus sp. D2_2 TaxID=3073092 RepID=UPI002815CF45|nr:VOC family protein [Paenibacillus sp. D2_2]WMT39617.1 VOC family protein [Paenibacillus sp. D2_2]